MTRQTGPGRPIEGDDFYDMLETAQAVRAARRVKVDTLDDLITACRAEKGYERIGGLLMDMTTKSMLVQVWDAIQAWERGAEFSEKLRARFNKIAAASPLRTKGLRAAILDAVDRFWKIVR